MDGSVRRADQAEDYLRFNVNAARVEGWEDACRESLAAGRFEWWYFEVFVPDGTGKGTHIVVAFLTKPLEGTRGELQPVVSVRVRLPEGGAPIGANVPFDPTRFSASSSRCDVVVGTNRCVETEPGRYQITFAVEGIAGTIDMQALAPATRIGTGHLLFARAQHERYFGWLVAQPLARAVVDCTVGERRVQGTGVGYHDHNWGDSPLSDLVHHWYWARATAGGYVVIAANVSPQADYGAFDHTDIVLIKDGQFIAKGQQGAAFEPGPLHIDGDTGKPLARALTFTFFDGDSRYIATFAWRQTALARPLGDAAYHRCLAAFTLEVCTGQQSQTFGPVASSYEMMWFGSETAATGLALYTEAFTEPKWA